MSKNKSTSKLKQNFSSGIEPADFSSLSPPLVVVADVDLVDEVTVVIVVMGPAEVGTLTNPRSLLIVIMSLRFSCTHIYFYHKFS